MPHSTDDNVEAQKVKGPNSEAQKKPKQSDLRPVGFTVLHNSARAHIHLGLAGSQAFLAGFSEARRDEK